MIPARTRAALAVRKGQGALLGNRTDLAEAGAARAARTGEAAPRFAENVSEVNHLLVGAQGVGRMPDPVDGDQPVGFVARNEPQQTVPDCGQRLLPGRLCKEGAGQRLLEAAVVPELQDVVLGSEIMEQGPGRHAGRRRDRFQRRSVVTVQIEQPQAFFRNAQTRVTPLLLAPAFLDRRLAVHAVDVACSQPLANQRWPWYLQMCSDCIFSDLLGGTRTGASA